MLRFSGIPLLISLLCICTGAHDTARAAPAPALDVLAGTWTDLDSFASVSQCISGPPGASHRCSPAFLSRVKEQRFEGKGLISATDSVLSISDALRKRDINSAEIQSLFSAYNYSDLIADVDLSYFGKNLTVGLRPLRYQGQFQVHNPNLPLATLVFRRDIDVHVGTAKAFTFGNVTLSAGATAFLVRRQETKVEATLLDLAGTAAKDLIKEERRTGYFFDLGLNAQFGDQFSAGLLAKDFGNWFGGAKTPDNYLFVLSDRERRVFSSVSYTPRLFTGRLQVGLSTVHFLRLPNKMGDQWFGGISYYIGPTRLLTGFRPGFLRTGLATRFSRFEVNVAQEWVNKVETGRKAQPRFTLEITSGL